MLVRRVWCVSCNKLVFSPLFEVLPRVCIFTAIENRRQVYYPQIMNERFHSDIRKDTNSRSFISPPSWKDLCFQRKFLQDFEQVLQITCMEDWNRITRKDIIKYGGSRLLHQYENVFDMIRTVFLERKWDAFAVPKHIPNSFWEDKNNQRTYFIKLALLKNVHPYELKQSDVRDHSGYKLLRQTRGSFQKYLEELFSHWPSRKTITRHRNFMNSFKEKNDIRTCNDWRWISEYDIRCAGGSFLLRYYKPYRQLFNYVYPGIEWESVFTPTLSLLEQQKALERIGEHFQVKIYSDWIRIPYSKFYQKGGKELLQLHESYFHMLQVLIPTYSWIPFEFSSSQLPPNFWDSTENQKNFIQYVSKQHEKFGSRSILTGKELRQFEGGRILLRQYGSLNNVYHYLFPEQAYCDFENNTPKNFLKKKCNQKKFLEYLGDKHFNITCLDDWYNVSPSYFRLKGGKKLVTLYNSFSEMLMSLYPEHQWDFVSNASRIHSSHWKNIENVRDFVKKIEEKYQIQHKEEWYRVSINQIQQVGGSGLLSRYRLIDILKMVYPFFLWDSEKLAKKDKRARQRMLYLEVKKLFPHEEVIEEYRTDYCVRNSGIPLEFDIFIPGRQLAFEYQGEHHYKDIPSMGNIELHQKRDREKEIVAKDNNICLVHVPFWLNFEETHSLKQLITKHKPGIWK